MLSLRVVAVGVLISTCCPLAKADVNGTPPERAACRPDVRKFCHAIKPGSGSLAFLSCLQANRPKLSRTCRAVLSKNGQ